MADPASQDRRHQRCSEAWAISMKWSDLGTSFGWWPQLKTGDIYALRCPSLMGEPDGFESKEYLDFCFAKMACHVP